ncbi:ABC transporter ATP-binding protein [soil metagenome]
MNAHGLRQQLGLIFGFIRFVYPQARRKAWLALCVQFVVGLTEGVSIILLVPILAGLRPGSTELVFTMPAALGSFAAGHQMHIDLGIMLMVLVAVVAAQAILVRVSGMIMVNTILIMTDHVRLSLFRAITFSRYRLLIEARHSDLNQVVTIEVGRAQVVLNSLFLLAQGLFMLTIYLVASLMISPLMTLIAGGFGVLFLAVLQPIRRYTSAYSERLTKQQQAQQRTIAEFLGGLKLVKSLNAEPRYLGEFSANMEAASNEMRRFFRVSTISPLLFQTLSAAGAASFVYIAIRYLQMPLDRIAVLLFILLRISPRFTGLQAAGQLLLLNIGGYTAIKTLIDRHGAAQEPQSVSGQTLPRLTRALSFRDVDFRYGVDADPTLRQMSFEIPAGQITAIIGPSGGGKSTVADLMLGLLEPTGGQILLDDEALTEANRRSWRSSVAYVPQEVFLAHDTIARNLRLAAPDADESALWRALSQAQAATFVAALPDGLQTVVGERGARMSGGERQRIALARALLTRPQLLILDEATSALDWENQNLIARAIEQLRGQMTIVTIAHRPSMIAFADWIVAIEAGQVVEAGRFGTVVADQDSRLSRLMIGEGGAA